jgi:hypothetical protein
MSVSAYKNCKIMMRTLLLFCFLASISLDGWSQDAVQPLPSRNVFKFSPVLSGYGARFGLERFDKKFSRSMSLLLSGTWVGTNQDKFISHYDKRGLSAEAQYRWYFRPMKESTTRRGTEITKGMYLAGFGKSRYEKRDFAGADYNYNPNTGIRSFTDFYEYNVEYVNISTGVYLGYQIKFLHVMVFDIFGGAAIQFSHIDVIGEMPALNHSVDDSGFSAPGYQGFLPKIGMQIGFFL